MADDHLDPVGSEVLHQGIKVSPGANTPLIRQEEVLKSLYRGIALLHSCQADVVSPGGKGTGNVGTDRLDPAHDRIEGPPIDKRYIQNSLYSDFWGKLLIITERTYSECSHKLIPVLVKSIVGISFT